MKLKLFYSLTVSLVLSLWTLPAFSQLYFEGLVYDGLGQPLLNYPTGVSVSPSGNHLYVISYDASAINVYNRSEDGTLTFVNAIKNDVDGVSGIGGAYAMMISPEGNHVYVAGSTDNSVAVFNRDAVSGNLSFVEKQTTGMGDVIGLSGANSMALSPDGNFMYVTGADENAVVVFRRNVVSGALTFVQVLQDENGDVIDLNYPVSVSVSPDGQNVYAASYGDNALTVFSRNNSNGMLTFQQVMRDNVGGVSGMGGTYSVKVSPDGMQVYCVGIESNSIALFNRDMNGNLTYQTKYEDDVNGVDGLMGVNSMTISPNGKYVMATGGNENALAVFSRDEMNGTLTFMTKFEDGVDDVTGMYYPLGVSMSNDGKNVYVPGFGGNEFVVFNMDEMGNVAFEKAEGANGQGVDGLAGASAVTVSPDGKNVYATGDTDNALTIFSRDEKTGMMTFMGMVKDDTDNVDGLEGATSVVVSPDGKNVYAAGFWDDAIAVFDRDEEGMLTFNHFMRNGVDGIGGIYGINAMTISPDGKNVYATGFWDGTLAVFNRDVNTGVLTFVNFFRDGVAGVDGLNRANSVTMSKDGVSVYVTGSSDDAIALFSRNVNTGMLTYVNRYKNSQNGVSNMDAPFSAVVSPDGSRVYVGTNRSDALVVFDRNLMDGTLTYLEAFVNGVDGVSGLDGIHSVAMSTDGLYVYTVSNGDNAVSVFRKNVTTGSLVFEKSRKDGEEGVNGINFGYSVALSPNNRYIYVAGNGDDALALFSCTYQITLNETICEGDSVVVGGSTYKIPGSYLDTFDIGSCINIVNLDLEVQFKNIDVAVSLCEGDVYEFAGVEYMTSGNYTQAFSSSIGCDSIVTLHLEVVEAFEPEMIEAEICSGEKYILGTTAYDHTGTYTQVTLSDFGCEQKVILDLQVLPAYEEQITEIICEGELFVFGTANYTTTGTYTEIMTSMMGCDSMVTLNLVVLPRDGSSQTMDRTICEGEFVVFGGEEYATSGTYSRNLTNGDCSGEIILNLEVLSAPEATYIDATICEGETYLFDGKEYQATGVYEFIVPSVNGCDSMTFLNLVVEPEKSHQVVALCAGETIQFGNEEISVSGNYNYMATSTNGCETTFSLNLTVLEELVGTGDITADNGQGTGAINTMVSGGMAPYFYAWSNGKTTPNISNLDAGTYTLTLMDSNGCEATYTYTVNLNSAVKDLSDTYGVRLVPNLVARATTTTLVIDSETNATLQLRIFDTSGRQLQGFPVQVTAGQNTQILEVPQSAGLYLINLLAEDGRTQSFRLNVQ